MSGTGWAEAVGRALGLEWAGSRSTAGGCISDARVLTAVDGTRVFLKSGDAEAAPMLAAEAAGLRVLADSRTVRVPAVLGHGVAGGRAWLALEYLELGGSACAPALGRALAALHRVTGPRYYGLDFDNTIGATPQQNAWSDDWVAFWRERRLRPQLELAERNGHGRALQAPGERVLEALACWIAHRPPPALLHGDLWGGNQGCLPDGTPVVYDPAPYHGDRETDLAMTELFGGFGRGFLEAYAEAYPLDPGYPVRRDLYQLYHVLNHVNLFGAGYVGQARRLMERLLAGVR